MRYVILQKATVQPYVRYRKGHLERVRSYERMSEPTDKSITLPADIKNKLNKDIHEVVKQIHFEEIPLGDIFDALKAHGVVPIAEDGTEWSGLLVGREGQIYIDIAPVGSKTSEKNIVMVEGDPAAPKKCSSCREWIHPQDMYADMKSGEFFCNNCAKTGVSFYKPFKNAKLALSWYKMPSGRYEVLSHVA